VSFEIFTETGSRTKEFISVTETKAFGLSRAFLDKHKITGDHKAVILYDVDTHQVALSFTLKNPKFGFSVRISNEKHGATIIARSFFDLKNIDAVKYAGRYDDFKVVPLIELGISSEDSAYVIDLKERETVKKGEPGPARVDNVVVEGIGDEPINLDDIPF
jgi:hypothetical protein